ncbi:hypothetical protein IIA15_06540 [candidate division TA06 bacterium]|nr:hypothetical protein [candidate division TA06 bacterium]
MVREKRVDDSNQTEKIALNLTIIEKGYESYRQRGTPDFFLDALDLPPEQKADYRKRILSFGRGRKENN